MKNFQSNRRFEVHEIKPLRLLRNQTQSKFSKMANINQTTLSKIEKGQIPLSDRTYRKIYKAFQRLRISEFEYETVRKMITHRQLRGWR